MISKAVGKTIKEIRKARGITQEGLAEMIDSHQVYISEIERGLKTPSLQVLYDMSKAFGITLTELISNIEKEFNTTNLQ